MTILFYMFRVLNYMNHKFKIKIEVNNFTIMIQTFDICLFCQLKCPISALKNVKQLNAVSCSRHYLT